VEIAWWPLTCFCIAHSNQNGMPDKKPFISSLCLDSGNGVTARWFGSGRQLGDDVDIGGIFRSPPARTCPHHPLNFRPAVARSFSTSKGITYLGAELTAWLNRVPPNCKFEVDDAELEWTSDSVCAKLRCAGQYN
jgi:hypothetical protein